MADMTLRDAEYAVDRLFCWADDETHPSTYLIFLCLTGNHACDAIKNLGYLEGSLLSRALEAWSTHPREINAFIDKQLNTIT